MGFRCNVIIIDLPLVKEADRQVSKINQHVRTGRAAGSDATENQGKNTDGVCYITLNGSPALASRGA